MQWSTTGRFTLLIHLGAAQQYYLHTTRHNGCLWSEIQINANDYGLKEEANLEQLLCPAEPERTFLLHCLWTAREGEREQEGAVILERQTICREQLDREVSDRRSLECPAENSASQAPQCRCGHFQEKSTARDLLETSLGPYLST